MTYTHPDGQKFHTGGITHWWGKHKFDNLFRPKVGRATAPYHWDTGIQRNYSAPIKNQYQASKCGGELVSQFMQIYRTVILGLPFEELSADSFYSQEFAQGGGMSLSAVQSGALANGIAKITDVPEPVNCTEQQAESLAWMKNVLPNQLIYLGLKMVFLPITMDDLAWAVDKYGAFCWMIRGQDNGTWLSPFPKPPTNSNTWAHFMTSCPSIPAGLNKLPVYNSWGATCGDNGVQYFDQEYINSGYIYSAFTFTKFTFDTTLTPGMFGDSIKRLQYCLYKAGFFDIKNMSGFFGPITASALMKYQKANGISPAPIVGPLTRALLNK